MLKSEPNLKDLRRLGVAYKNCAFGGVPRTAAFIIFGFLSLLAASADSAWGDNASSQSVIAGDYNNGGPGFFRRMIVSGDSTISYEIWRATPNANIEYLHFTLVSPANHPIESNRYKIRRSSRNCGFASLQFYRHMGQVSTAILLLGIGGEEVPFSSAGAPLSAAVLAEDKEITEQIDERFARSAFLQQPGSEGPGRTPPRRTEVPLMCSRVGRS